MATKIIIRKGSLVDAVKKLNGVFSQMQKKDSAVILLQAAELKKENAVAKALTLTMFNGSTQIAANIRCEADSVIDGQVSVPCGTEFIAGVMALAGVAGDAYTIEIGDTALTVKIREAVVTVRKKTEGIMPIDFDVKDKSCIEGRFILNALDFRASAGSVLFAALNDDNTSTGGVAVMADEESVVFRVTDRRRLAEAKAKIKSSAFAGENKSLSFVVSPAILKMVMSGFSEGDMVFVKTTKHLTIQYGSDIWQIPLINHDYPHEVFVNIRAKKQTASVSFDREEMLVALDIVSVSVAVANEKDMVCSLSVKDGSLMIRDEGDNSKAAVKVDAEGEFPKVMCFATKFLKTCVAAFKGNKITMSVSTAVMPGVFEVEGEEIFVGLCPVDPAKRPAVDKGAESK